MDIMLCPVVAAVMVHPIASMLIVGRAGVGHYISNEACQPDIRGCLGVARSANADPGSQQRATFCSRMLNSLAGCRWLAPHGS